MREILCKGKIVNNGKWIEGYLLACGVTGKHFILPTGSLIKDSDEVGEEGCIKLSAFEVIPETVGQYTGLTDKNGNKIFEGDITKLVLSDGEIRYFKVSIKSVTREVVCHPDFDDTTSKVNITGVVFEWDGYELFPCINTNGVPDYKMMEVIGNIHDNPELLEDENK